MKLSHILAATAVSAFLATGAMAQTTPQVGTPAKPAAPAVMTPAKPAVAPAPAATIAKKINLNTAPANELDKLPQIGEARAKAIMEARAKARFKNWDDFVSRNVVPKNAEDAIKALVSF